MVFAVPSRLISGKGIEVKSPEAPIFSIGAEDLQRIARSFAGLPKAVLQKISPI